VRAGWCFALAACGRVAFDPIAPSDGAADGAAHLCAAPVGHDEDGDGVDDACDGCPHIADPDQVDTDLDGVDDICDPNPTQPIDSIAFFDPFVTQLPVWTLKPGFTYQNDQLVVDERTSNWAAKLAVTPAHDQFTVGAHLGASGTGQRQLSIWIENTVGYIYYCEVNDDGTGNVDITLSYDDASGFHTIDGAPAPGPLGNGVAMLTITEDPVTAKCRGTWQGTTGQYMGTPPAITPSNITIYVLGLQAQLDYFLQIHSQ
jgi:hypothetical protein